MTPNAGGPGGGPRVPLTVWLGLGALVAVGAAARCRQYAGCPSYWYDEAYLLLNVFHRGFAGLLGPLGYQQAAPPAFLWALRGLYELAGGSERVMRLPAFLSSLAALALMVPLARRLVGGTGWAWAVALCAVSNHAVTHGYEVKPYASDALVTTALLLGAAACLRAGAGGRRAWGLAGFALAAPLAPWVSFPSVYVAAGAALALLAAGLRRRSWDLGAGGLALGGLLLLSVGALWFTVMRHQNSAALQAYWSAAFPDLSSPGSALLWTAGYPVALAHYGTAGMGVPLALLMGLGAARLGRRARSLAVLLLAPLALAWVGAALHRYPLADRLLFFAVPCAWLLAAEGMAAVVGRLSGRWAWAAAAVLAAVLVPGTLNRLRDLAVLRPKAEFREAFAFVEGHRAQGDRVLAQFPEVYQLYHGGDPALLPWQAPTESVRQAARGQRLWLVFTPTPGAREHVRDLSRGEPAPCGHFFGVEVVLYESVP